MKKSLFILFFLFSVASIDAQTNTFPVFPEGNAVWNFNLTEFYFGNGCLIEEQYSIVMEGDSLINNIKYHKLFIPYVLSNTVGCDDSSYITAAYKGAVRVDSVNKKVFYIPPTKNSEELLYDFTLEVGDTLKGYFSSNPTNTVQAIDSVLVDSIYRKRWLIDDAYCDGAAYIIEGIGCTFGLVEAIPPCHINDMARIKLECYQDNQHTYNTNGSCQIITALEKRKNSRPNFNIFPNPTAGAVQIESAENIRYISVYNLQGQKVQEINPQNRSWDLPQEEGLYFIRMEDKAGNTFTKKVVKH